MDVYTMGQGAHLFERFGHAAICVVDDRRPARGRCYNYGTTNFRTPPEDIGWDFVRGRSRFWVSVWKLETMVDAYSNADRDVYVQRLPFTPQQVQQVDRKLRHDALEANRYYVYHHFDDNCTTRVRDIVDDVSNGALRQGSDHGYGLTFRQLGARGLADEPWIVTTGYLLAGRRLDEEPTLWQAMFHPDVMRAEIETRLGAKPELVHERRGPAFSQTPPRTEGRFLAVGSAAYVPAALTHLLRPGALRRTLSVLTGLVLGLIGCAVWFMALAAEMRELSQNEMVLVFWPWDLVFGLLSNRRQRGYARLRAGWLVGVSLLSGIGALQQPLLVPLLIPLLSMLPFALGKGAREPAAKPEAAPVAG